MDDIVEIKKLFLSVSEIEKAKFKVEPRDMKRAISNMAEAYRANPNWENSECHTAEYDDAGHRCAYLHKYAMMHTGLVCDIMQQALYIDSVHNIFQNNKYLTLCSLGSGPGTDILALLFLLVDYMPKRCTAYLIDKSIGWSSVFDSIINELRTKSYSNSKIASACYFNYQYLRADLLDSIPVKVYNCIKNADIVTMIKFVSAAACKKTRPMIKDIFIAMKPGAIFLYIDNAAGGFYEMVKETANLAGMDLVFEPLKHYEYVEEDFKMTDQNGSTSQYKTRVTAAIWRKLEVHPQSCCSIQMDGQSSARLHAYSGTENVKDRDFEGEFRDQCAIEPVVNKGFRQKSRYSFDEVDHISSQNIKLHSHSKVKEIFNSGSCCLIM